MARVFRHAEQPNRGNLELKINGLVLSNEDEQHTVPVLDFFHPEPLRKCRRMFKISQVILTAQIADTTIEASYAMARSDVAQIAFCLR